MGKSGEINQQLKRMKAQMEGTVDINYEKYNNVYIDKVAQHNSELKKEKSMGNDQHIQGRAEEAAKYLHNKAKGRSIYI